MYDGNPSLLVQSVCPSGWYIPSNRIWKDEILGLYTDYDLKSLTGWMDNGNNTIGFNILNSGYRFSESLYVQGASFFAIDSYNISSVSTFEIPDFTNQNQYFHLNLISGSTYPKICIRCIKVNMTD